MKTMLILGGTKGIGDGCAKYFSEKYKVLTVARSNSDFNGDLCNSEFHDHLLKTVSPDVLICSAGTPGMPLNSALLVNFSSTVQLISKFYESMKEGSDIVNISSIASLYAKGHKGISLERISYNTSKQAISDFCISLAQSRKRNVKVSTVEPDLVLPTHFNAFHKMQINPEVYANFDFKKFTPIRPIDIAKTVEWILDQPKWMNICRVTINNNFSITVK